MTKEQDGAPETGARDQAGAAAAAKSSPPKPKKKPRRRLSRQQQRRRMLLRSGLAGVGLMLLQPVAHWPLMKRVHARLRPPGSSEEDPFLGACIKCGQCVQVCPVNAITFADIDEGFGSAAPYIDARAQACDFSCDALSCILACPTGALSHDIRAKEDVRIGVARLTRPDACRARSGEGFSGTARGPDFRGRLRYEELDRWNAIPIADHPYEREICDLCVTECPIGDTAIRLETLADSAIPGAMTPVVQDACERLRIGEISCASGTWASSNDVR
jgi:ferredoxin-type protein NapG